MTQFNVASFLSERALTDPNAPAVCFVKERSLIENFFSVFSFTNSKRNPEYDQLSFLELDQSVNALVHNLSQRGVKAGMRTLLMVKPGLDLIQIVFALFKIGAVPVVIDPGMGIARFFQCAKQSKVEWVLGKPLAIGLARWFFSGLDNNKLISTGRNFARAIRTELGKHSYSARSVEADTLAAVLFTSGSTGAAKGVRYTHGMFYAQVQLIREAYSIEAGEVDLPMLAVFALFNPALGMCTVVPEMNPSRPAQVKPRKIVDSIDRFQVTNSFGSPTLWKLVTDYCEREGRQLPSLKRVIMAGAPAPQNLLTRLQRLLPKGEIFTPYGATEALP
ncbi:MAG: peptide synthase, partial [Puniceicoccaceae bacterium]